MDTKIILVICASLFALVIILFLFSFIIRYQRKSNAFQAEKKIMQSAFEQELLKANLEIREQTLKNISQEIHDNIGQVLSLAKLHLGTMDIEKPEGLPDKISSSKELVTKAIQDLRNLSKSLDTDSIVERGIVNAAKNELDIIQRAGVHQTHLSVQGDVYSLELNTELILFRVLQELLNNIIKHARAKNIVVDFIYKPNSFEMKIKDDGNGFDLNAITNNSKNGLGLGLKNMHNRARMVNAVFFMESFIGKGTNVIITVNKNQS
jgi:two-component system, NarL family, sensor kinase